MISKRFSLFFIVVLLFLFFAVSCWAKDPVIQKNTLSKKGKIYSDPDAATADGYKVGQTVMVKGKIIYKLDRDSKTGKYTFKKYRLVKKRKKYSDPNAAAAAGYKVGQTVMVKNNIIYRLAKDPKTGGFTYKRYRAVKKKAAPAVAKTPVATTAHSEVNITEEKTVQTGSKADVIVKDKAKTKAEEQSAAKVTLEPDTKKNKQELTKRGQVRRSAANGRNMKRLAGSVAFRHSFFDRKTELTDRIVTQADGTPATVIGQKDSYSTDMHNDSVRLRLGLSDSFEVFTDLGLAYDKLSGISDMEPVFGGGIRYNITKIDDGFFSGLYLAVSGEYLQGKLTKNVNSVDGLVKYLDSTDWQDMTATLESGIQFSKLSAIFGCSYMLYSEKVTTKQTHPLTDRITVKDELEQKGSVNFSGGIEYRYSPSIHLLLEVQAPNRQGGIMSVEYRF